MPIMGSEDGPRSTAPTLSGTADSRDMKPRSRPGEPGSLGDQAFKDALIVVVGAWAVLLFLSFTLRSYNV